MIPKKIFENIVEKGENTGYLRVVKIWNCVVIGSIKVLFVEMRSYRKAL